MALFAALCEQRSQRLARFLSAVKIARSPPTSAEAAQIKSAKSCMDYASSAAMGMPPSANRKVRWSSFLSPRCRKRAVRPKAAPTVHPAKIAAVPIRKARTGPPPSSQLHKSPYNPPHSIVKTAMVPKSKASASKLIGRRERATKSACAAMAKSPAPTAIAPPALRAKRTTQGPSTSPSKIANAQRNCQRGTGRLHNTSSDGSTSTARAAGAVASSQNAHRIKRKLMFRAAYPVTVAARKPCGEKMIAAATKIPR